MNIKILGATLLAAAVIAATPASAETKPMAATALLLKPLTLTKRSDLDFGSIIPSGSGDLVTINADTGARTSATAGLLASDPGGRARFASSGLNDQVVLLLLSPPGDLDDGNGNRLQVTRLALDNGNFPLRFLSPASQVFFVGIGGTVFVRGDQEEGAYTGTFNLTAYYF